MLRTDEDPELLVFDPVIRFFHWLTLFLVATIFVLAFSIDFASSKEEAVALIQLHRSFGVTVWVVTLGRLVWRQFSRFPNWPADMPQAMRFAAQWSEYALYALMLTQPILGLLHTNAHGDRANLFFLGQPPALIGQDRPLAKQLLKVHETVGLFLLGLIALHASAALYHHFWRRDDTLEAMLPQGMRRRVARRSSTGISSRADPSYRPHPVTPASRPLQMAAARSRKFDSIRRERPPAVAAGGRRIRTIGPPSRRAFSRPRRNPLVAAPWLLPQHSDRLRRNGPRDPEL
jgi:cytochrome b561